jgi:hypothetical protein
VRRANRDRKTMRRAKSRRGEPKTAAAQATEIEPEGADTPDRRMLGNIVIDGEIGACRLWANLLALMRTSNCRNLCLLRRHFDSEGWIRRINLVAFEGTFLCEAR